MAMREAKDRTLGTPKLLIPSIQVNMRAGHLPPAEDNGVSYLKVPVNVIGRRRLARPSSPRVAFRCGARYLGAREDRPRA